MASVLRVLLISQLASFDRNARGDNPQAVGHTLRRFTFTDKRIGTGRECGLLTGVQMADEDNDQRGRAGFSEFSQSLSGGAGKQIPIHQQHIGTARRRLG